MTAAIACPECGETERLQGRREGREIVIRCAACRHEWRRNLDLCPKCGKPTIADKRVPLLQKARGTQQSIVGYNVITECWSCGYSGG